VNFEKFLDDLWFGATTAEVVVTTGSEKPPAPVMPSTTSTPQGDQVGQAEKRTDKKPPNKGPTKVGDLRGHGGSAGGSASLQKTAIAFAVEPDLGRIFNVFNDIAVLLADTISSANDRVRLFLLFCKSLHDINQLNVCDALGTSRSRHTADIMLVNIPSSVALIAATLHPVGVGSGTDPILYVEPAYVLASLQTIPGFRLLANLEAFTLANMLEVKIMKALKHADVIKERIKDIAVLDLAVSPTIRGNTPMYQVCVRRTVSSRDAELAAVTRMFTAAWRPGVGVNAHTAFYHVPAIDNDPNQAMVGWVYSGSACTTAFNPDVWMHERLDSDFSPRRLK